MCQIKSEKTPLVVGRLNQSGHIIGLARQIINLPQKNQGQLRTMLLNGRQQIFRPQKIFIFPWANFDKSFLGVEAVKSDLRRNRILIRRKRPFLNEYLKSFFRRPVK